MGQVILMPTKPDSWSVIQLLLELCQGQGAHFLSGLMILDADDAGVG